MRFELKLLTMIVATTLVGCGDKAPSAATRASAGDTAWLLSALPPGAIPVREAKRSAGESDRVVVRGRIGGRREPMSPDLAVFVMMDPAVTSCEGCACKTPWDYCCETPETITANIATVQLVDEAGKPLSIDLRRYAIEPLADVVVVGTVGPRPAKEVFVIRATGLHRVEG